MIVIHEGSFHQLAGQPPSGGPGKQVTESARGAGQFQGGNNGLPIPKRQGPERLIRIIIILSLQLSPNSNYQYYAGVLRVSNRIRNVISVLIKLDLCIWSYMTMYGVCQE